MGYPLLPSGTFVTRLDARLLWRPSAWARGLLVFSSGWWRWKFGNPFQGGFLITVDWPGDWQDLQLCIILFLPIWLSLWITLESLLEGNRKGWFGFDALAFLVLWTACFAWICAPFWVSYSAGCLRAQSFQEGPLLWIVFVSMEKRNELFYSSWRGNPPSVSYTHGKESFIRACLEIKPAKEKVAILNGTIWKDLLFIAKSISFHVWKHL